MKIAVISDTHKKFSLAKEAIDNLIANGAQYIVHAGDVCEYDTIEYIKNTRLPYVAVYGNNDYHMVQYQSDFNLVKEPHYFKIEDVKFKLMHMPYYLTPDSNVVIYGHTHIFEAKKVQNTLFLNPGEVCAREKPRSESVLLHIDPNSYKVEYFYKKTGENSFDKDVLTFDRL